MNVNHRPLARCIKNIGFIASIAVLALLNVGQAKAQNGYVWKFAASGSNAVAEGIVASTLQQDLVYERTDSGYGYRWDPSITGWICISDKFPFETGYFDGVESLAVDPTNVNVVYMTAGYYVQDWATSFGGIFKSTDKGDHWTQINPAGWTVKCGSNDSLHENGERMMVDPNNAQIIVYGSANDGVWRTTNGGSTWSSQIVGVPTHLQGYGCVVFDKNTAGLAYISCYGDGIYKSTDHGATWSKMTGSPAKAMRMSVDPNHILYVSGWDGLWKYSGSTWTNITPANITTNGINGFSYNPFNVSEIICAEQSVKPTKEFRSTNGGSTWTQLTYQTLDHTPWGGMGDFSEHQTFLQYDPFVNNRAWISSWGADARTSNIAAATVVWEQPLVTGEGATTFNVCAPPSGPELIGSVADVGGWPFNNGVYSEPQNRLTATQDSYQVAFCATNPSHMISTGSDRWRTFNAVARSTDSGSTWTNASGWNVNTGISRCAMSATSASNYVVLVPGGVAQYTTNDGAGFASVTGLPNGPNQNWPWNSEMPICADLVSAGTFYYYDGATGNVLRSTNSGANFSVMSTLPTGGASYPYGDNIKAMPGKASEVWVSLDFNGLYHSSNGGSTFTKFSNITRCHIFGFGKPASGSTTQTVFFYGTLTGDTALHIYRSTDNGATWLNIQDPNRPVGDGPNSMEGSQQTFGRVFIGTGSGFYVGDIGGPSAPPTPTGVTATAGNAQVTISWTASSGATSYNVKRSTVSGSGYATIASPTTTSYVNTGLTNGVTYFYVVSAVNAIGESSNSSQVSAIPSVPTPQAQIAAGTATIDGTVEAAWNAATSYPLGKTAGTISGSSDCSASWQGLWDATNLYVLVNVTDDVKVNDSVNPWDDDSVEVYLDADDNGGTVYDANDRQIEFGWNDAAAVEGGGRAITGVTFAQADPTATTYRIEAKIPWAVEAFTPAANAVIGIDVHVNDDDDGAARDGKVIWNDGTDQAWTNPSLFGTGKLNAAGGIPAAPTGLTASAGNTQVALSWTASSGATSYNVLRSTVNGSGYASVATGIATTTYTNTGLTNGTTYYFVVTATNASDTSGNSTQASATPEPAIPAAPTGLTATAGNTQVALSWTASSGATSYNVLRSTVSGSGYASVATGIATTTYTNTGLTNGTTYYFVVTATNASGTSGNSTQASATPSVSVGGTLTGSVAAQSSSTVNLTTEGTLDWANWGTSTDMSMNHKSSGGSKISGLTNFGTGGAYGRWNDAGRNMTWTDGTPTVSATNDENYIWDNGANNSGWTFTVPADTSSKTLRVYIGSSGVNYQAMAHLSDGSATDVTKTVSSSVIDFNCFTFTYNAASAGQTLTITITKTLNNASGTPSVDLKAATLQGTTGTAPAAPTGLTATAGNTQVTLSWSASTGATSYNVLRSTVNGSGYASVATGIAVTNYTNTGLTNGTTYYFVVTATNASGTSGNSNQASATPVVAIPAAPTGLTAAAGNTQVALSWTASSGATSYNVLRSTVNGSGYASVATGIATTTYTNTGLTNGTTYYFVVTATNASGTSGNSTQASAMPSGGSLTGSVAAQSSTTVNLTTQGTLDWAHWGTGSDMTMNHKSSGGSKISAVSNFGSGGAYGRWNDAGRNMTWTDGTPTASATNDENYIWDNGANNTGWTFTVPADTTSKTLKIYVGSSGVNYQVMAHLSDGSAADVTKTVSSAGVDFQCFTFTYKAASASNTLTLTITKTLNNATGSPSVDLDAATLQ